jgi:hypothetical protein
VAHELAKQSLAGIGQSMAAELMIGKSLALENQVGGLVAADLERMKKIAAGCSSIHWTQPLLEAERERWAQIAEITNPCRGIAESLKIPTPTFASITADSAKAILEATLQHTTGLQQLAEEMSRVAFSATEAIHSSYLPFRIHALPASPTTEPSPLRARSKHSEAGHAQEPSIRSDSLLIPTPGNTSEINSKPDFPGEEARTQHLLNLLNRFLDSKEIPCDAREGLTSVIAWFKINQGRGCQVDGRKLNTLILAFLRDEHGLETPPEFQQLLSSGLLVPKHRTPNEPPELEPEIYTSTQLAKILTYNEASIRKLAGSVWKDGGGPQLLIRGTNWYVVGRGRADGGRGRGWSFQKKAGSIKPVVNYQGQSTNSIK